MERVNKIITDRQWQEYLDRITECETDRVFCRHNMVHFLDVARLAWIFNLEEALDLEKDVVYAAALLHDIGRFVQYQDGTPHPQASAALAPEILLRCGFGEKETVEIIEAIRQHGNADIREEKSLRGVLYRADKASRACYSCSVCSECDWSSRKKNLKLQY